MGSHSHRDGGRVKAEPGDAHVPLQTYTVVRMNPAQAKIVHAAFALEESPTREQVEELSAQTGLTVKWLKSWYQRTKTSKRKKKTNAKTSKIPNCKSEVKDEVLDSENIQVNSSTPSLVYPQKLDSQQSFPSRTQNRSISSSHEHHVAPQPYIGSGSFPRQDYSAPLQEQSNNNIPLHMSMNLRQYPRNNYTQPDPPSMLPSISAFFSQNEQHQFAPAHPEVPACEPVALESDCNLPYSSSGNHLFALPNFPNRPEHMYCHYTATGSLITPLNFPWPPDAQMYLDSNNVTGVVKDNNGSSHEAVTPTLLTSPLSSLDFSTLATQLPPSGYAPFISNAGYNYNSNYNTSSARSTPYNMNQLMYDDAAEKTRDFVLRSLNEELVDRDPFQAAMGLVVLSRLGLEWD